MSGHLAHSQPGDPEVMWSCRECYPPTGSLRTTITEKLDAFTPSTEQVRAAYVRAMRNAFIASAGEHEMEFDRWLDTVIAEVAQHVRDE